MKLGMFNNMFQFERRIERTHQVSSECEDIRLSKRRNEKCNIQNEGIQNDVYENMICIVLVSFEMTSPLLLL